MNVLYFYTMNCFYKFFLLVFFVIFYANSLLSTHNRAGEITYKQIGSLTIEMTIITYTKATSVAADRDSLEVFWGDGSFEQVKRNNNLTRFDVNDIKINYYIATHTYPGVATYTISFLDPNRVGGILNVNFPNSIDIPFFLSTTFTLLDPQFQGFNNSVQLLQPPIDIGCVDRIFTHNPNAFDVDGDSLVFELVAPLQELNTPVPNYRLPDQIGQFGTNVISINRFTGEIIWRTPKIQGDYNIAIKVSEYRNGIKINELLRDMQILIRACENEPPSITSQDEYCVIAGTELNIPLIINDPDSNQLVRITATGGPFVIDSPAVLNGPSQYTAVPFQANIIWNTNCNHVSDQYYQIVVRAVDNFFPDSTGLATLRTIRIKIVGPPPENLSANTQDNNIRLTWDAPYFCDNDENDNFRGFSVWRKISSTNYQPDSCNPGLSRSPYTRIENLTFNKSGEQYIFIDTNIENGNTYCYRVQGEFSKLTSFNIPFNRVEGLPSNETCVIKNRDLPLLTKVSVNQTDITNGAIDIKWTKPLATQFDTLINQPPYLHTLERATESTNFVTIWSETIDSFSQEIDTTFLDRNINTAASQYSYKVNITSQNNFKASSPEASSIYLDTEPTDRQINLNWESQVPWNNFLYEVFKQDNLGDFIKIGETTTNNWIDRDLENGQEYCYRILGTGTYSIDNIEDPLYNYSQESCNTPFDNRPPCPPVIEAKNVCDRLSDNINVDALYNTIKWKRLSETCPNNSRDLANYKIYFSPNISEPYVLIRTVSKDEDLTYLHTPTQGLSGCYYMTSTDLNNNESIPSDTICLENCPFYVLPNTFTPNNDGKNDLFKPMVNIFISSIDLKIYNQWGILIFETTDPEINWDGTNGKGRDYPDGTYYYRCQIFEQTIKGIKAKDQLLSGHINIIRN